MSEVEQEVVEQTELSVINEEMQEIRLLDLEVAIQTIRNLTGLYPDFYKPLPNEVTGLIIDTMDGQAIIPREELQNDYTRVSTKPLSWNWYQVYTYKFSVLESPY